MQIPGLGRIKWWGRIQDSIGYGLQNLPQKKELLSDYCYSILCDDSNRIWIGHKGGLSNIRIADFFVKSVQQFESINDNYPFNPNAILRITREKSGLGSEKGLISYDPAADASKSWVPVLKSSRVRINDEVIHFNGNIVLKHGKYKIRIDFLAVSLKEPASVTYQYKLDGYDSWSEITKDTSITYYHITDGKYTFVLKALSGDGIVSASLLPWTLRSWKPIWNTGGFSLSIALLLVMMVFFYVKRQESVFLNEKKTLEQKVMERTFEIQHQKYENWAAKQSIRTKNLEIMSSIRYARNIQKAFLPAPDLLDKLLPIISFSRNQRTLLVGNFYWLTEKDNTIIFTVADCTGHGVPGAFMSLLSVTMLNEIVKHAGHYPSRWDRQQIAQPGKSFPYYSKMDGLDLTLCALDKSKRKIQFTGAMNHLDSHTRGENGVIKADHFSINSIREDFTFTWKKIDLKKGDVIYLSSDGYRISLEELKTKKYSVKRGFMLPCWKSIKCLWRIKWEFWKKSFPNGCRMFFKPMTSPWWESGFRQPVKGWNRFCEMKYTPTK